MYKKHTVSVVIPCYNEEGGIKLTCKMIPKFVDEVVVVDNLSTDNTFRIAKKLGAKVIVENNQGYGFALKKGIQKASGDLVVTIDGDATYPIEDIHVVIDYLLDQSLDFVSCSRFPLRNRDSMHWQNLLGNKFISYLMKVLFLREFKDGLSGMWVLKREVYRKLLPLSSSWNLSEEIKIEAYLHPEVKFDEYRVNYHPRHGKSKLWPFKVGVENIGYLFYLRFFKKRKY
ncbi:glycosyltransferase family 2 protein [Patescibacteria group bacterium]